MTRLLAALLLAGLAPLQAGTLYVGSARPWANLQQAAAAAAPGDTILFDAGTYAGGQYVARLAGTPDGWITIRAGGEVVVSGGGTAWQLSDPAYVAIEGFVFEHQTLNGVNIDDGGTYGTPAHHVRISGCTFRQIDATGNNDLLKLSGLDDFEIADCRFADGSPGGSGIDMVGCHRGTIERNRFERMGSNAIQAKGGTALVMIARNFFLHCGARTLNLGGSTGLDYFRPPDAPYEASDLLVWANVIVGSDAPVAYVGAVNTHAVNNTIVRPQVWVTRILQETVDPLRFLACGDNSFRQNLIVLGTVRTETNVGPNTRPETFTFRDNYWHRLEDPSWPGPSLPVIDPGQVVGPDPGFVDSAGYDFHLPGSSPAAGLIAATGEPLEDFDGRPYAMPRSAGAFEAAAPTSVTEDAPETPGGILLLASYPNPFNPSTLIEIRIARAGHVRLDVVSPGGALVARLLDGPLDAGTHTVPFQASGLASGLYIIRARSASSAAAHRVILLR